MRAKVKVVIFFANKSEWGYDYCSYCPAINFSGRANTPKEVIAEVQSYLLRMLCYRDVYTNLQNLGWGITDNSIKYPTFTDENAVSLTERYYSTKIVEPKIIVLDVEVPTIPKS